MENITYLCTEILKSMSFLSEKTMARRKMHAFLSVVDKIIHDKRALGEEIDMENVYIIASKHKAPCYFVQLEFAARQLTLISRGKKPDLTTELKQQMYYDIYNEYIKVTKCKVIKKLNWEILAKILNNEAKSFYINPSSVKQLINIYYRK